MGEDDDLMRSLLLWSVVSEDGGHVSTIKDSSGNITDLLKSFIGDPVL